MPYFIIEGSDGAGKTSIIKELIPMLLTLSTKVVATRQPGDPSSEICQKIRQIVLYEKCPMSPITQEILFLADMQENIEKVVRPLINDKYIVVSDRGIMSHLAYVQAKFGDELPAWLVTAFFAVSDLCPPAVNFLISRDMEATSQFLDQKAPDNIEALGTSFQKRVNYNFHALSQGKCCGKVIKIHNTTPRKAAIQIYDKIEKYMELLHH